MKILVTGGTGVIGAGALPELLKAGHEVRLLTRRAAEDAGEYPSGVEAFPADVSDPESLRGAAEGCGVVIHITGIVEEQPPEVTFEKINVGGTRNVLRVAEQAGVRRFIFLSSLGADTGESKYHQSKLEAEQWVQSSSLEWIILRPGNVYGPGDDVISMLLKMVRTLPAVPMVGSGEQAFQPIWFEDLGKAVARCCDEDVPVRRIYELAGPEVTTPKEVIDHLSAITGRRPARVPLPAWMAQIGVEMSKLFGGFGRRLVSEAGLSLPLNRAKLKMLEEGNVTEHGEDALRDVFGVKPTPLAEGLNNLADQLPELLPEEGIGRLCRKRFWAEIRGTRFSPERLMEMFQENIVEVMPIDFAAEPGAPLAIEVGTTLTGAIPGRGNFQVRVEEMTERRVTLATVEGHPMAGTVRFQTDSREGSVVFAIEIHTRSANIFDFITTRTVGAPMQNQNWKTVVKNMVALSEGEAAEGVQCTTETLEEEDAAKVEKEVQALVQRRKKEERRADQAAV